MLAPQSRTLGTVVGASLITLCALPSARADIHLAIGSRLEPLRYSSPYFPDSSTQGLAPAIKLNDAGYNGGFSSTALSPYLGLFFAQRYGIMAAVDIAYAKLDGEQQAPTDAMPTKSSDSYFSFGLALGLKIYISQPRPNKVAPYVYADFYKYFTSLSTDNTGVTGEQAAAQAALRSPIGATFAFGVEYFLGSGFSIGSEILGIRVANVSAEYHGALGGGATPDQTRHSASYTQMNFYTGLTLNYRFQVSASVKAAEDRDHDDDNARKHQNEGYAPPPPQPPPPPPSPEAVD